jgi:orotidine-5'-phosphate decarboxylase
MVAAAVDAAENLKILAVTVLTSLRAPDLASLGIAGSPEEAVLRLADMALDAGAAGLVCSGREAAMLRERFGPASSGGPVLVVPGIRLAAGPSTDQQRTFGPRAAVEAGSDLIVVGRPITGASNPGAAARSILEQLTV